MAEYNRSMESVQGRKQSQRKRCCHRCISKGAGVWLHDTVQFTLSAPSVYNFVFKKLKYAFRVRRFQLKFPHNGIPFKQTIVSLNTNPEWMGVIFCIRNSSSILPLTTAWNRLPSHLPNLWVAFISFKVIASGGFYVLGQEQDELAANFSANEAFIGQMSQLNIWSYEVSSSDIADMARHAENYVGNVIGWSDFYDGADSGIKKIEPSVARTGKLSCF